MSKVKIKQLDVTGTPDGTKYLRDDGTWGTPDGTGTVGHVIEDEGVARTQRAALDFVGMGVTATDDAVNDKTVVTVPGMEQLRGAWTALASYVTGDVVDFDKDLWRALQDNINTMPSSSTTADPLPAPVANDGLWNLNGTAAYNGTDLVLVNNTGNSQGNAILEEAVALDGLDFTVTMSRSGTADALGISLLEPDVSPESQGGTAGSAGVLTIEGLHAILNFYNTEAIRLNRREGGVTTQLASVDTSVPTAQTQYRIQVAEVSAGNYTITLSKGGVVIHNAVAFTFPTETALIAFGAGSGGFSCVGTVHTLTGTQQIASEAWVRVYDGDAGGGGGGGSGHVIMDEGTVENTRTNLDFQGDGVTVADDPIGDKTIITIPGAGTITGRFRGHWAASSEEVVWSEDFSDISGDGIPDDFVTGGSAEVVNAAYAALASGGAITPTPPARIIRLNGMGLHSTTRYIELNLNNTGVPLPTKIRYWRTTSVEGGWDPLVITSNGSEITRYTGATPWGQVTHTVNSGQTIRWTMHKDGSGNSGSDACAIALVEVLALVSPNYQVNDVVIHADALWRCLSAGATDEPGTNAGQWEELPGGSGGGGGSLATLTDVDLVTDPPVDQEVLAFSDVLAKWVPVALADGATPRHALWKQIIDMPGDSLTGLTTYQGTWLVDAGVIKQTNSSSGLSARARFDTPVPPGLVIAEMEVRFDAFQGTDNRVGFLYGWPGTDSSGSFKVRLHCNNGAADTIQSEMESTTALQAWAGNWAGVSGPMAWHKFRLIYNGNDTVQVWVDDVMIGIGTDVRLIKDGKYLGLFIGGAAVSLRNIKVWTLNPDLNAIIAAASTIRSGTVDPTGADGNDGDWYINKTTWTIFGPKAAGAWPAGTSLVGPEGDQGIQGPPGDDALIIDEVNVVAATGAAETLPDVDTATVHDLTLDTSCVLTFPAAGVGKSLTVVARQDATGGRTIVWPASVKWPGGVAPTLSTAAGDVDIFSFMCTDGTNWFGFVAGQEFS